MNPVSKRLLFILAIIGLTAGILLSQLTNKPGQIAQTKTTIPGLLWPNPKQIKPFQLIDQNGKPFNLGNLKGHWSLLFFGYTHCPDICPTTMTLMNSVVKELSEEKETVPQVIFITVDPERDTQKHMTDYVAYFNPTFLGLTGTEEDVATLTKQLGILSMKITGKNPANIKDYLIDHSASILLIGPKARLIGIFSAPHDKTDIKQRYLAMVNFITSQDNQL